MVLTRSLVMISLIAVLVIFLVPTGAVLAAPSPIDELLRKGEESLAQMHLATAETRFQEALRLALAAQDRKREAMARNGIGRIFPGDPWVGPAHLRLALAIHRELADLQGQASDLAAIGESLQISGSISESLPFLKEALALTQKLGSHRAEISILENLGVAEQAIGSYEDAEAHLAQALDQRRKVRGNPFELLRLEVRLGSLRSLLGRYELAEECCLSAALNRLTESRDQISEQQWEALRTAWVAQGQRSLQGMGPAAAAMVESLNHSEETEDPELTKILGTDGALPLPLKRGIRSYGLKTAEESTLELSKIVKPELLPILLISPICEMEILTTLSRAYLQIGRPEDVTAINERAWSLVAQQDERDERLLGIFETTADPGVVDKHRGAYRLGLSAPPSYSDAYARNDPARSDERLWQGDLAASQGRVDEAIQEYRGLITTNRMMRPMGLTRIASLHEMVGDTSRALATYRQAIDAAEAMQSNLRLDELVAAWASQQASAYARTIHLLHDLGQPEVAFSYAERSRGRAFLNAVGNRRLPSAVPPELSSELRMGSPETDRNREPSKEAAERLCSTPCHGRQRCRP